MNIFKQIKNYNFLKNSIPEMTDFTFSFFKNTPVKDATQTKFSCKLNDLDINAIKVFFQKNYDIKEEYYVYISTKQDKQNPKMLSGRVAEKAYDMIQKQYSIHQGYIR